MCSCAIHDVKPWMLGKKIVCPNCSKNVAMPSSPFGVGRMIGDYIIEEKLGEGSIGTVYLAHQASLDRKVALKILSEQYANAKGMSAFLSEARSAAKLLHPNLVQCFGVGEENGVCYMAMNYIKGKTLKDKIKSNGKIDVDEALHITQQVAEALHCAWEEARLIHRDVKPENIMIDDDGVVKLTDLGLAMPQTAWHENMEISGSPSYMSPEQFTGEKLDSRSDIYSLGVSLYQMLCGKLPFVGKTLNSVARQHFKEKAVPINKLVPTTPRAVSDLVG
ncbi:MAG TPA: protein kinase, partial [Victivallales bacterium]|nr:protein kinase [Victivallales bacterium]